MAGSGVTSTLQQTIWGKKALLESYANTETFNGMFETITNKEKDVPKVGKPIVVLRDFVEQAGTQMYVPFVAKLAGEGVNGDATLEGNEQELKTFSQLVYVDQKRQAAKTIGRVSDQKSMIKLFEKFKPQLSDWLASIRVKEIIRKAVGNTAYTFANTPTAPTAGRIAYAGTATATNNITTSDKLDKATLSKVKVLAENQRLAGLTDTAIYVPPMAPINFGKDKMFLTLVHPEVYNDFYMSADVQQMLREAGAYQAANPLIQGGDLYFNRQIIRACEDLREHEVATYGSGANLPGAITITMGSCAVSLGEANDPRLVEEMYDYQNVKGIAIDQIWGCQKTKFNGMDFGVVTTYSYRTDL